MAGLVQENVDAQVDAASEGEVPRVLRTGASVSVDVVLSRGVMEALPQPLHPSLLLQVGVSGAPNFRSCFGLSDYLCGIPLKMTSLKKKVPPKHPASPQGYSCAV